MDNSSFLVLARLAGQRRVSSRQFHREEIGCPRQLPQDDSPFSKGHQVSSPLSGKLSGRNRLALFPG